MTRFEFIKKDGKKHTNHNKVIELIQDIEALDSICMKVLRKDEGCRHKHEEKNSNSRERSADKNKHSNNHGCHNKPSQGRADNSKPGNMPRRCPRHDHKWQDCPKTYATRISKRMIERPRTTSQIKRQTQLNAFAMSDLTTKLKKLS